MQTIASAGPRKRIVLEAALLAVLPVVLLLIVGASTWTPPNTPDSEFYLTLGVFGHDITARALTPAYYWTRLGVVSPMRLFTWLLGPDAGVWMWRWLMISVAIVPTYFFGRRLKGVAAAAAGTAFVLLNSVFITVVGNTYPTGAVVSLLIAEGAVLGLALLVGRRASIALVALAGAAVGWVAMSNQIAAVFAILLMVPFAVVMLRRSWRHALLAWALAAAATALVFTAFLWTGTLLFPGLDWLETTRYYAGILDSAAFRAADLTWLGSSPNLIVIPLVICAAALVAITVRRATAPVGALALGTTFCLLYALWSEFVAGGVLLQTPVYVAMLWGPSLILGAAVIFMLVPDGPWGWAAAGAFGLAAVLVGTYWTAAISSLPWGILVGAVAIAGLVAWRVARAPEKAAVGIVSALLLVGGVQVLQNGTPVEANVLSLRIPFWTAYRSNLAPAIKQQDIAVQQWVIDQTAGGHVLVWAPDPAFGSVAAMSLNGPNALSMTADLSADQITWARTTGPGFVLSIAGTASNVRTLATRLRQSGIETGAPKCTSFKGVDGLPTAFACVTGINVLGPGSTM